MITNYDNIQILVKQKLSKKDEKKILGLVANLFDDPLFHHKYKPNWLNRYTCIDVDYSRYN